MKKSIYQNIQDQKTKTYKEILKVQDEYKREAEQKNLNKDLEANLYKEFKRIAKNKKFIDLEQVEALGVYYDILIITSIKNTGKSVGIAYKVFDRCYKEGKKVIFMRSSQKELKDSKGAYNATAENPFKIITLNGVPTLVHKETGEEVGLAKDFKFCNSGSGGEFEGYGAIVYDEFMSWDTRKSINQGHCLNWAALISSITRNKKDGIKVYCLGNLTGLNTNLLDFYGINRDDDLRYIKRYAEDNPSNVSHILYINTNDIYEGIKSQVGATNAMAPEFRLQMYKNKGDLNNMSIIEPALWDEMINQTAFIVVDNTGQFKFIIEVRKTKKYRLSKDPIIYAMRCREWHPFYPVEGKICTDNYIIWSTYNHLKYVKDSTKINLIFLQNLIICGVLYFYDKISQDLLINLFNKSEAIKNRKTIFF